MNGLELDWMLTIDETGMPKAPTLKQLLDRDVSLLYTRDKSPNKEMYVKEVGVIYYLGDPKGPCLQDEDDSIKKDYKYNVDNERHHLVEINLY
jgi:hypothetical protein